MRKLDRSSLEFMVYMTRVEWQLVYSLSFALSAEDVVPDHANTSLGALFRWTMAHLRHEHGYEFEALKVSEDGDLWTEEEEPVSPDNAAWLIMIRKGAGPDYSVHLPDAIDYAERMIPSLDTAPMREALRKIEGVKEEAKQWGEELSPEVKEAVREKLERRKEFFERATKGGVN